MRGGADETEQLPEGSGLVPPSAAFSLNGKPKSLACARRCGKHGWRVRHPAPEIREKADARQPWACAWMALPGRAWL